MNELLRKISRSTLIILALSLLLIVYGAVCRAAHIYFFWESRSIGGMLLLIGLISFLLDRSKASRAEKKSTLGYKIGIGIIAFILLVQLLLICILPLTDAYARAKQHLMSSKEAKERVGDVKDVSLLLTGGIQKSEDASGESGYATINLIVKGDTYKDATIYMYLHPDSSSWNVDQIDW
jgi:hypothetical protein